MEVRILATGGTFDKEYDELRGQLFFKESHLTEILKLGRCRLEAEVETVMLIDSLEMTEQDRRAIVEHCLSVPEERIIITHGTDTMVETARLLATEVHGKTIVLTGAMIPFAFGSSDGLFNIGGAMTAVQILPNGVYIVMNGQVFPWYRARKNRATGIFERIPEA
ncbi:MAG: asparaginase domain-containing protein [Acidobacteriota bacterium]